MEFNNINTTYDNVTFGAPMFHHQQQQSESFTDQMSLSATSSVHTTNANTHHNPSHYYAPQSLSFLDEQLTMPTTMTPEAAPCSSNENNKKKPKRKQVKNACVNCQKACKKCDDGRACQRCIKLGLTATCVDSPRKERRKGIKRGPYKKRQPRAEQLQQQKQVSQQSSQLLLHTEWFDNNDRSNIEYHGSSSSSSPVSSLSSSWNQQQQFAAMEQHLSFGSSNFLEQPCYPATNDINSFIPTHINNIQYANSSSSEDGLGQSPSVSSSIAHSPCSPATPLPPPASAPFLVVPSQQYYSQQIAFLQKQQQRTIEQQKMIEQQVTLSMQGQEEKHQAQQYYQQQ
ncbi:hypothetical protein INT45_004045, partial [Circinella minor]